MKASASLTPSQAIQSVLKNYTNFNGRARRSEFWLWYSINLLIAIIFAIIVYIIFLIIPFSENDKKIFAMIIIIIAGIYGILILIPSLSVQVRRLHDIGRSGWWCLLIILQIGGAILLVMSLKDSEEKENDYGPSPKYKITLNPNVGQKELDEVVN